ncbi:MAG: DNA cytosine methyltransferase [Candidatus Hodarchaeales archaeon]
MTKSEYLRILDLFCGAGGFSEGFRQAGFDVVSGIDNWQIACDAHDKNGFGKAKNENMFKGIDKKGAQWVRSIKKEITDTYGEIDVIIGSPPCTEFSYAKNGGRGDIEKGMLLVRSFLVFVAIFQPRFWIMENVPRLETALLTEAQKTDSNGWEISLRKLGVTRRTVTRKHILGNGSSLKIPYGEVLTASNYGCAQDRKRFVAGNINLGAIDDYRKAPKTLGDIIEKLHESYNAESDKVYDPNYDSHCIPKEKLRDYDYCTNIHPLYWEHMRHLKQRHIQYGRMAFPDHLSNPARTVLATLNPSSREAITIDTKRTMDYQSKSRSIYRLLSVREAASLQGFPISFQLLGKSLSSRYRLIGNAVPCQLAFALARCTLDEFENIEQELEEEQRTRFRKSFNKLEANEFKPIISNPLDYVSEALDIKFKKYTQFSARSDKHIRRKLLSSKIPNNSAVVVFENTDWTSKGKRIGGTWKSCLQLGVGGIFSQVYLDNKSIPIILNRISNNIESKTISKHRQTNLSLYFEKNMLSKLKQIVKGILNDLDNGIPLVPEGWVEFPGYNSQNLHTYATYSLKKRKRIPSSKKLQQLFTMSIKNKRYISPLDIWDGLDAIILKNISSDGKVPDWILEGGIKFSDLHALGYPYYKKRISDLALPKITGTIPLTTLIASLVSVYLCRILHDRDKNQGIQNKQIISIVAASKKIAHWCGHQSS